MPSWTQPSRAFEPIITAEIWEQCQGVRATRKGAARPAHVGDWPLTSLLRCQGCGGPMVAFVHWKTLSDGERCAWRYYRCKALKERSQGCESTQMLRADVAHRVVWEAMPKILAWASSHATRESRPDPSADEASLVAKLQQLEKEEHDLWKQKQVGMPEDRYQRLAAAMDQERKAVDAELAEARRRRATPTYAWARVGDLLQDETLLDDWDHLRGLFVSFFRSVAVAHTGKSRTTSKADHRRREPVLRLVRATLDNGATWPK